MPDSVYAAGQEILLAEMHDMVTEWCRWDEEAPWPRKEVKRSHLRRRESARVQAAILHVMRDQLFAGTVEDIIDALVNKGLWLPSLGDGMMGYRGELWHLMRLWIRPGTAERVVLVVGNGRTPDSRWQYESERWWETGFEGLDPSETSKLLGIWPRQTHYL